MEEFSTLLAICAGNSPVTGEFPAQRPVTRSFDVSLICARINGWVNNGEAGDLRRLRAHYDVIAMYRRLGNPHNTKERPQLVLYQINSNLIWDSSKHQDASIPF